ncbi:MAG: prenyltransferase/squalene oxidase repeat-containing protein, partial [Bacteriovorax sp.]
MMKHTLLTVFLSLSLLLTSCSTSPSREVASVSSEEVSTDQVKAVVESLKKEILSQKMALKNGEEYYDMTAYLGTLYTSMYFLSLMWTKDFWENGKYVDLALQHKKILTKTQNDKGGWYRVLDVNLQDSSDVSATIMNYWFLKAMGEDLKSLQMKKAREFILNHGSLEKADLLTKIFMSLFRNYDWNKIPWVPYLIFNKYSPVRDRQFAAWLSPHILPIAILRNIKASKFLDPKLSLKEFKDESEGPFSHEVQMSNSDFEMVSTLINDQRPRGSWGGYLIASIFARMAINRSIEISSNETFQRAKEKAQGFLDKYLFNVGASNFLGATQDGHVWDTALLTGALIEAKAKDEETRDSLAHLIAIQTPNGGFPFGYDFEKTPDVDDTAEVLMTLKHSIPADDPIIQKGLTFISSMQNNDGGFAAFSKNNQGNFILNFFARPFTDSADLFDESSSDVTGHVLEALGILGRNQMNSLKVRKAVDYLRKNQNEEGAFYGRWGVNYIYGTSAALAGLSKVGVDKDDPMVVRAINWLISKQNKDGGFGESTLSYSNKEWMGVGESTPSQTAWALIGLLKFLPPQHRAI